LNAKPNDMRLQLFAFNERLWCLSYKLQLGANQAEVLTTSGDAHEALLQELECRLVPLLIIDAIVDLASTEVANLLIS